MSDASMPWVFWLAFFGLVIAMLGLAGLLQAERQRALLATRLSRATGTGPMRKTSAEQAMLHDQRGSLAFFMRSLRHIVLRMGERLSVILGGEALETASDLASAGYRGRDALLIYAFLKTTLPVATLGLGMIWVLTTRTPGLQMLLPSALVLAIALGLSKAVDGVVNQRRQARLTRIRHGFPDMLELLVISSEAGLGPQPALQRVAQDLSVANPDLAQEVLQMVSEMRMTNDRRAAYEKLNQRVPLPEIGVFTQTLDQSDTFGTPFARAMRALIEEQRTNRLIAVEEKAARLPVIMTIPLIFCIMPAVFVVLIGPAALGILDNILGRGTP